MYKVKQLPTHWSTPETCATWRHHARSVGPVGEVHARIVLVAGVRRAVQDGGRKHGHVHAPAVVLGLRGHVGEEGPWLYARQILWRQAVWVTRRQEAFAGNPRRRQVLGKHGVEKEEERQGDKLLTVGRKRLGCSGVISSIAVV